MGSAESTTRKVSFGIDEEDRVRILRGIKLSEDVLQRMRGVANIPPDRKSTMSASEKDTGAQPSQPNQHHQSQSNNSKPASHSKDEQRRNEWQQKILKEELARMAETRSEAVREDTTKALTRERLQARHEAEKAKKLIQQLQKKDSQLRALDAFYKEQLAQLEKKNLERYNQSKEQFHQAASEAEAKMRARTTAPVCSNLQAQILSCYRGNKDRSLQCADLAKAYMQCIDAAKKNLLINQR